MAKGKALEPASATKTFLDICLAAARKACSAASPGLHPMRYYEADTEQVNEEHHTSQSIHIYELILTVQYYLTCE